MICVISLIQKKKKLNQTRYTQPAILATSVAISSLLQEKGYQPDMVAWFVSWRILLPWWPAVPWILRCGSPWLLSVGPIWKKRLLLALARW